MLATHQFMLTVALVFPGFAFFVWRAPRPTRAVDMSQAGH
ncbi:hypothetical protein RA8CHR_05194 [Variovorax sp. RA8]|nr:hypothetical protein RA8CHR_05194 [Variovorax sp. RA8]